MPKPVVSQNERLLLHLLEMDDYRDEPEVPLAACQEGIAQRLGTQVNNASRALSSLQAEGLVMDRLAHVRGAPKRRRAYFLTEKGHRAGSTVKESLQKEKVVYEEQGRAEEMTLRETIRRLQSSSKASIGFLDFLEYAREADVIRYDEIIKKIAPAAGKEKFVELAIGRPKLGSFFGRDDELRTLSESLDGEPSTILIWGIPGIGKSSLASKVFEGLSGKRHLFWYGVHTWDTEEHFMTLFSRFLKSVGRSATSQEVDKGAVKGDLFAPLMTDMAGLRAVFFFDDLHKASGQFQTTLSVILEAIRSSESPKVVLISRAMPTFFSRTSDGSVEIELSGLDRESATKLAQSSKAIDPIKAVDASMGHPLLLTMMARGDPGDSKGDILSFIDREVNKSLDVGERAVLELLSVFRHPVPTEVLISDDPAVISRLKDKSLIMEQEQGVWTHDVLREFFLSRLNPETRARHHARAAEYCEKMDGTDWMLESLHHYVQAGDVKSAKRIALSSSYDLTKEFPEETLRLMSQLPPREMSPGDKSEILFLMGQLSMAVGDDASAAKHFEACLEMLPESEDTGERAAVLEELGKLKTRVEEWAESFAAHEKALRLYEKADDKQGQVREWINIGGAHRRRGDLARAREAYSKALSLASMSEDRGAQSACMNNLALLDLDEGKLREAETRFKESIRLAHAMKNHMGEAKGLENLAELFRTQGRISEMTNLLLESSEAFRRAGEIEDYKRLQAVCAESLGAQGRASEGIELCRAALADPELRKRAGLLQRATRHDQGDVSLELAMIGLLRSAGDFVHAEEEVGRLREIAVSMKDATLDAKADVELALVKESSGDLDSALEWLREAEKALMPAGEMQGMIAVNLLMGMILEKKGDYGAAGDHYREASRQAEIAGDSSALRAAKHNLESIGASVNG